MAPPINFTNSFNNRGCKSQGPANMNSSFSPNHLLFKNFFFSNLCPLSGYSPFSFLSFTSISTFPLPIYPSVCYHWSSAPTTPMDLFRYFLVLLLFMHSSDTFLSFNSSCLFLSISNFLFYSWYSSFILSLKHRCYPRVPPGLLLF